MCKHKSTTQNLLKLNLDIWNDTIFFLEFGFVKPEPEISLWGHICSSYGCGVRSIHDMFGRMKQANRKPRISWDDSMLIVVPLIGCVFPQLHAETVLSRSTGT